MPCGPSTGQGIGLFGDGLEGSLRLLGDGRVAFHGPILLLTTSCHFFFGLSFAFELFLPLGKFILTLLGHISSYAVWLKAHKKTPEAFLRALGL
jgi:hypothetical protein